MMVHGRIAHFDGDRDRREERLRRIGGDVVVQAVNAHTVWFAEISDAALTAGEPLPDLTPAVACDEDIELNGNAGGRLAEGAIEDLGGDHASFALAQLGHGAVHVLELEADALAGLNGGFGDVKTRAGHAVDSLMRRDAILKTEDVVILWADDFRVLENVLDVGFRSLCSIEGVAGSRIEPQFDGADDEGDIGWIGGAE